MDFLSGIIWNFRDPYGSSSESLTDVLNSSVTTSILILFAVVLTTKQEFFGDPISCWAPSHFTESHQEFTNRVR